MLLTQTRRQSPTLVFAPTINTRLELSRLIATAVVDQKFCQSLLTDPERAVGDGYQGEPFLFSSDEQSFISSIRANSLKELANQLVQTLDG